jgi:phage shock protein PspC (stress-responsive transcriptional regulator)
MKRLLDLVRSERPVVAGTFGRLAGEFGFDRAVVRIIGFLILWAGPYCFGAPYRSAWIFSILAYIALTIFVRRRDRFWRHLDRTSFEKRRARRDAGIGSAKDCNGYTGRSDTGSRIAPEPPAAPERSATTQSVANGPGTEQRLGASLADLEERLARLDQRIQKMETVVTDRAFDWDRRLRKG